MNISDLSKAVEPPGLGYGDGEEPNMWSLLWHDRQDLVIENENMAEKEGHRGKTDVYCDKIRSRARVWKRKGDYGRYDEAVWTVLNGQELQVSAFNYSRKVKVHEEGDGAVYGLVPEGYVSSVTARVSGFATGGKHAPSRCRLVELMEEMSRDKIVAFHVAIGVSTKAHKQLAYTGVGFVQFATHKGLRRALDR